MTPRSPLAVCLCGALWLASLAACERGVVTSIIESPDASTLARTDAGAPDAATPDASTGGDLDAGTVDSGVVDAGERDAGEADAGQVEPVDAGPRELPWTLGPVTPPPAQWLDTPPECTATDWLAKYFHYRTRLRGDGTASFPGFVSVGTRPGESLPASMRSAVADCATDWWVQNAQCRLLNVPHTNGKLEWGDTTIWLGWYLTTLASEHAAFKLLGVDTNETENDIYSALQAFNRLDEVAESFFPGHLPARDGFFVRGDVPGDFIFQDPAHTLMRFPRSDGGLTGYGCIESGTACGTPSTRDGYFESQDQVIGMLPGLAMVAKLVPPGTFVNGVDLAHESKAITHRMVTFLKSHNWVIRDPTGESPPNEWGGNAVGFSNQIAKSANFITDNALGVGDYRDAISITAGAGAVGLLDASWLAQNLSNQSMMLKLETVSDEWDPDKLARRAAAWDSPVFPMMNAFLHGRPIPAGVSANEVEAMLTSAPCSGPCHNVPGCEEAPGWKGEHRFKSPEQREGSSYGIYGEYNGLDYMLLHNLYVIMRHGKYQLDLPRPTCRRATTLDAVIQHGASAATSYDPWDACNIQDFRRDFCGRSFAGWLDAAYRGEATIFLAGARLSCTPGSPCQATSSSASGTSGDDLYVGWNGTDTFEGGDGNDCLYGFDGADTLKGQAGRDELHGGPGNDTLCGEGCLAAELSGDPDVIYGDEGDDTINGGPASDQLFGGPGNDTIRGGPGGDFIDGEDGDDDLDGEMGEDTIHGGNGNDRLRGGMDNDMLFGDDGRDKLDGAMGNDQLSGGNGDDFLMGGEGDDTLNGGPGSDRLCGGCGDDTLRGGWESGADSCRAKAANSLLCFGEHDPAAVECESDASPDDCRDAAFDAW